MAYEGNFVQYIFTFLCVLVRDNEIVEKIHADVRVKDPDFLLCYDTIFLLGKFYIFH